MAQMMPDVFFGPVFIVTTFPVTYFTDYNLYM